MLHGAAKLKKRVALLAFPAHHRSLPLLRLSVSWPSRSQTPWFLNPGCPQGDTTSSQSLSTGLASRGSCHQPLPGLAQGCHASHQRSGESCLCTMNPCPRSPTGTMPGPVLGSRLQACCPPALNQETSVPLPLPSPPPPPGVQGWGFSRL